MLENGVNVKYYLRKVKSRTDWNKLWNNGQKKLKTNILEKIIEGLNIQQKKKNNDNIIDKNVK